MVVSTARILPSLGKFTPAGANPIDTGASAIAITGLEQKAIESTVQQL
jgi:hypothetical protein